ncbi:MAG TPA: hypothetical protein VIH99_03630 [Bdellovibrionota bacterium]|jgi:hypothetical protein
MSAKQNQKFLPRVLVSVLACYALYLVPAYYFTGLDERLLWVHEMKTKKDGYALSEKKPKILFLGGSATLMGLNAEQVSRELGRPAFNMAKHAGLGLNFYLTEASSVARPGDVIVLIPEYELYQDGDTYNQMAFDYYRIFDHAHFQGVPLLSQLQFLRFMAVQHPFDAFLKHLLYRSARPGTTGYGSDNISPHGDQTKFLTVAYTGTEVDLPKKLETPLPALPRLLAFQRWCEENGIRFYLSFPNTLTPETPHAALYLEGLASSLKAAGLPTMGKPRDFFLERRYFTDTSYHLNKEGVGVHTAKVISFVRKLDLSRK